MINLVQETIKFYFKTLSAPKLEDIEISSPALLEENGNCFVTIFLNGEIQGSSGNIKEMKPTLAEEIIENTLVAISEDERFSPLTITDSTKIKVRVDLITSKKVLSITPEEKANSITTLSKIDPIKSGVIAIKKDYSKLAVILPNIDPKILVGNDYQASLSAKLQENFKETKYIIYQIETIVENG